MMHGTRVLNAENVQGAPGQHLQYIMAFRNGCRATLLRTVVACESVKTGDSQEIDYAHYGERSDSLESCAWGRDNRG